MVLERPAVIGSLGELLVEFVCESRDGHHRVASTYAGPYASGAPGIFIDQAARVGAQTVFVGAVGDDAFGSVLRDRFAAVGVGQDLIRTVPGVPTGSAFVSYNSDGSRDFVFNIAHSAASRFSSGPEMIEALRGAGVTVFHISGSTLGDPAMAANALEACEALHASGVAISLDPNIRKELLADASYRHTVRAISRLATFLLPSLEDAEVLYPGESFETFAPRLRAQGVRHVVLKRGEAGCSGLSETGEIVEFPAHSVTVADPTGAGDCFCATFVALTAAGMPFRTALERANAAGALAVQKVGPMEGNSTLAEIEALLAAPAQTG